MTLILSGTNGVSDIDGDASTPALRGTDANSGVFFGSDVVGVSTGGSEKVSVGASALVINDGGADFDFRVEGDTDANMLFVDASADVVAIGTSASGNTANKLTIRKDSVNNVVDALLLNNGSTDNQAGTGVRINMSGVSEANSDIRYAYIESATASAGNDHYLAFATNAAGSAPAERMRIDPSGNLLFNSGYGSVATAFGCRAWVNFNGTGTVAIREDGNVSSISDLGTGYYVVNFSTAMPDVNYAANVSSTDAFPDIGMAPALDTIATGSFRIVNANLTTGAYFDSTNVCASVFR